MRWLLALLRALLVRRDHPKGMVRPWALAAPVLVLLVTLPLLRPIRFPDPRDVGDDEQALLATTQALVEFDTPAIDQTQFTATRRKFERTGPAGMARWYADQPPTTAALLSVGYRLIRHYGLTFAKDGPTVAYLLTLLGTTIPAACAAGLVYRMGRLFDLARPRRALLAAACVFGTGLLSYATVLNAHVPAATLVLASAACLVHLAIATRRPVVPVWLFAAGLCAALAAALDPSALPFLPLMAAVTLTFRWRWWARAGGLVLFVAGAAGPAVLHLSLTLPVTGDPFQGMGFAPTSVALPDPLGTHAGPPGGGADGPDWAVPDDADDPPTAWRTARQTAGSVAAGLFGAHGLLSHFPVLAVGVLGMTMVMHRHWPQAAKVLAAATVAGAVFLLVAYAAHRPPGVGWRDAMFAARWFVVFGPLLLVWAGAWLRRPHRRGSWAVVGALLAFSAAVGVVGATRPWPRDGYRRYTAAEAARKLWRGESASPPRTTLAGPDWGSAGGDAR
ncbi:MAG: hypothetical protein JWO31_132 [Phycisphaerales bacterium]|nr:hypothetical protein [Phycisphaerales bacterium]